MKLLIDTHIFLWLNQAPEKLSHLALATCQERNNPIYLSLISLWEIQIKSQMGKLTLKTAWQTMLEWQIKQNGLQLLALQQQHIEMLEQLPYHHKDPFDRLLISQAQCEAMTIITADDIFRSYSVPIIA